MFITAPGAPGRSTRPERVRRVTRRGGAAAIGAGLAITLAAYPSAGGTTPANSASGRTGTGCEATARTWIPQPSAAQLAAAGFDSLPLAPTQRRVDLLARRFSHPDRVTNPLFPISELKSVVLNGKVEGKRFRTETTLMPDTRIVEWRPGQCVRTVLSQYTAYLDGRVEEVAIDHYAQSNDGAVWYLGEEVFNYQDGIIAETSGTWAAGKEGPAAMIMPGRPRVGQAFRPENIPGLVFEEVSVKRADAVVDGPRGRVRGALVATELHSDGTRSDKVFAPGYGEFYSAHEGDVEALALAVPIDSLQGPVPSALKTMPSAAVLAQDAASARRWSEAGSAVWRMKAAWSAHKAGGGVPPRLVEPTDKALAVLDAAVKAKHEARARDAALEVLQATLDLQLQFRPPAEIDRARFELWSSRVIADAEAHNLAGAVGDVTTLEWIRDRITRTFEPVELTRLDKLLGDLRTATSDEDLTAAVEIGAELQILVNP